MPVIEIKTVNMGGIADSDILGSKNSVAEMVGLDIHSEPGFLKVNQKLTKRSAGIVDAFVKTGVSCSDGSTYLFGMNTGKIWQRNSAGVYSLVATVAPPDGDKGITGSCEYQGFIYYAMELRLGRWQIGTPWTTRDDNFATFSSGNSTYHPMKVLNRVLYIGDGNLVAQVDTGVYSANALDLDDQYIITCLGQLGTDLLLGTNINSNVVETQVFRWNTWSVSFTNSDPIPEVGINAFLPTDNFVIVSAGTKGNLYSYDGSQLNLYKTIKGQWGGQNTAIVYPEAILNFHSIPLFGFSGITGTPGIMGIYSLARSNVNYPYVLNCEYLPSTGDSDTISIGTIIGAGNIFLTTVRYKDGTYGVDELDLSLKFDGAYLITRLIMPDRMKLTTFGVFSAGYRVLPEGCDISFEKSVNYDVFVPIDDVDTINDTERNIKYTNVDIGDASSLQAKLIFGCSENLAPEVDVFHIDIKNSRTARPRPDAEAT